MINWNFIIKWIKFLKKLTKKNRKILKLSEKKIIYVIYHIFFMTKVRIKKETINKNKKFYQIIK